MCYLFPIGACTAFTGIVAMVSLIAAGGAGFAAAPFFINPDSVTFAVNGHGVCLEPRLDAPCERESACVQQALQPARRSLLCVLLQWRPPRSAVAAQRAVILVITAAMIPPVP